MSAPILFLIFFGFLIVQFAILKATHKPSLRLIPIYIILLAAAAAALIYFRVVGGQVLGEMASSLIGVVMLISILAAISGTAFGWVIYLVLTRKEK